MSVQRIGPVGEGQKPLSEVVKQIESGADRVSHAATAFSKRIEKIEDWLSSLKGKVPAEVWIDADPDSDVQLGLRFGRDGREWSLFCAWQHAGDEAPAEWSRLREASIETKLTATELLPMLVRQMTIAQDELIGRIGECASDLDKLAAELAKKEGA